MSATPKATGSPEVRSSAAVDDWRQAWLVRIRALIREAAPAAVEERKWKKPSNPAGVPCWCEHGLLCTGETYRHKVKLTFAQGARLDDPDGLFNAGLDGRVRRAIDLGPADPLDDQAFIRLVRAAVALNRGDSGARQGVGRRRA